MMEKVPVPVIGASYSPCFFVCFTDLFFRFRGFGVFLFQLFLQLLISGIIQCVIDADPVLSSEVEGGFPLMPTGHQGSRASE
jgi:hypothetical protein